MEFLFALLAILIAYLLGSINFAIIFSKIFIHKDVRDYGSHNAGMTNTMRVAGVLPGALTFIFDVLKGVAAAYIGFLIFKHCYSLTESQMFLPIYGGYLCAVFCMLGHCLPVFFQFKGGKAVATCLGVMIVCNFPAAIVAVFVFALLIVSSRMVSLSSIIAVASMLVTVPTYQMSGILPFTLNIDGPIGANFIILIFNLIMVFLVVIKHKENIDRMLKGTERKVSFKKENKNG